MKNVIFALLLGLLGGCAATTTPIYDTRFGDAVRESKRNMTVNPDAGRNPDPAAGIDGKAARESMILYQDTYKAPPPVVNVINIGGNIGNGK
jgi:hypothetical protein